MELTILLIVLGVLGVYLSMKKKQAQELKQERLLRFQPPHLPNAVKHPFREMPFKWLRGKTAIVTGGNGFLGKRLVEGLKEIECKIIVVDLPPRGTTKVPDLGENVEFRPCDLRQKDQVVEACKGGDVLFHCATPSPFCVDKKLLHDVNYTGTEHLLEACKIHHIERFINVSSASVVFNGVDQVNADESTPHPTVFRDPYCFSKVEAEDLVLSKNSDSLRTVAIRPHSIYGPGDNHNFPTVVDNARRGKTKFQIGDGSNIVDYTYVDNVVYALMLAADQMEKGAKCAGQAYFITNDEPIPFWDMMSKILIGLGYEPPHFALPYQLCYVGSKLIDYVIQFINLFRPLSITFTPSKVQLCGMHHYYSCKKAKEELGYKPLWSNDEGLENCFQYFTDLRNPAAGPRSNNDKEGSGSGFNEKEVKEYSLDEIKKHNKRDDVWIIVKDRVYDVSEYVDDHPGGDAILNDAGDDATVGFYGPQHPPTVAEHIEEYYIGNVAK